MAINDIVQTIAEARVDARSLSEFVFKPAGFKVARRLAPPVDTLQFYINRFNSLNGDFSSSVSVALSSLNNSVAEADGKVAYIESTVQDAINNTAVEGGVLADTFVTVTTNEVGTVARTQRDINSESKSLLRFGKVTSGANWSPILQLAANIGGKITIPKGNYKLSSVVNITKDIELVLDENAVFTLDGIDRAFIGNKAKVVIIRGGKFIATRYVSGRPHVFATSNYPESVADLPHTLIFDNVKTYNMGWASALIDTTVKSVDVRFTFNSIDSDDTTDSMIEASGNSSATAWLYLIGWDGLPDSTARPKKPRFKISDNIIDVWHQTETNTDVIKTAGFITKGYLQDNIIINRNINSQAEIDMFSAGERLTVVGNNFKNISTKIQGSLLPAHLVGKCRISGNDYEFEDGTSHQRAMLVRGSVNTISGNTVTYKETYRDAARGYFTAITMSSLGLPDNGFGDEYPAANSITGNTINLDVAAREGSTLVCAIHPKQITGCAISSNVFSGGFDYIDDSNPEARNYNTWTGNNIYSPHFTPTGIFRMQSTFNGSANRISTSHGGEVDKDTNSMIVQNLPTFAAGEDIYFTLDTQIKSASLWHGMSYLLHIEVKGSARTNRQVFLVTNIRNTRTQDPWIVPFYSVIGFEETDERSIRHALKLGYVEGKFAFKALGQAGADGHDPTTVSYGIESISSGLYYR